MFDWATEPGRLTDAFDKKQKEMARSDKHPAYQKRIANMSDEQKNLYYNYFYTPIFNKQQYDHAIRLFHLSFRRYFCHNPHSDNNISEAEGREQWKYMWADKVQDPTSMCRLINDLWLG